jgi:hypothetical protein
MKMRGTRRMLCKLVAAAVEQKIKHISPETQKF